MIDSIEKLKMKDKDIVYLINEDNNCRETFKLLSEHLVDTKINDDWQQLCINKMLDYLNSCANILDSSLVGFHFANLHFTLVKDEFKFYTRTAFCADEEKNIFISSSIPFSLIDKEKLDLINTYFTKTSVGVEYKEHWYRFLNFFQTPLYQYLNDSDDTSNSNNFVYRGLNYQKHERGLVVSNFDLEIRRLTIFN